MKPYAIILLIMLHITNVMAQDNNKDTNKNFDETKIEPRKYIVISEDRKKTKSITYAQHLKSIEKESSSAIDSAKATKWDEKYYGWKRIWHMDEIEDINSNNFMSVNQSFIPVQKYNIVDIGSTIRIDFDRLALMQNIKFFGSLSLSAQIIGKDGYRNIEVSPYSLIGEDQTSYGVFSLPPREIVDRMMRLVIYAKRTKSLYNCHLKSHVSIFEGSPIKKELKIRIDTLQKSILKNIKIYGYELLESDTQGITNYRELKFKKYIPNQLYDSILELNKIVNNGYLEKFLTWTKSRDLGDLEIEVKSINFIQFSANYSFHSSPLNDQLREFLTISRRSNDYMKEIMRSGNESKQAFLNLIGFSTIEFDNIQKDLNNALLELKDVERFIDLNSESRLKAIVIIAQSLGEFSVGNGEFQRKLGEKGYDPDNFLDTTASRIYKENLIKYNNLQLRLNRPIKEDSLQEIYIDSINIASIDLNNMIKKSKYSLINDDTTFSFIKKELAKNVGEEIYSKLIYATIDLAKAKAVDGERLEIKVLWYKDNILINEKNSETLDNVVTDPIELVTAIFILKETGWIREIRESALLIKRIDEDLLREDYPLSPSNFKPTGGVSLIWHYKTNKRGNGFCRGAKWFEPSVGINVAYLDFNTEEVFEIGVGPVIGLWGNSISITYGYNLMANKESPWYWGIGFSFTSIKDQIVK